MKRKFPILWLFVGLFLVMAWQPAFASTGTIDATNHYAWDDNGGYVNWYATGGNVTVTDTALTGYLWSAGFGWINLSPALGGVTNSAGTLGGYAWGANTGWINFAGITIDSNGLFHGQTTPQSLFGTMTFDCTYCNVTTAWRNSTVTPTVTNTGGGGVISGSQSVGYQNGSGASSSNAVSTTSSSSSSNATPPKSLVPTTPPPKTEPTIPPSSNPSQPAHLTPNITLSIYTAPSAVAGTPLAVNVNFSNTKRTQNITVVYRLYASSGATLYSASSTLTPTSMPSFVASIPTTGLPVGTYTVAVSAQYGKQAIATQTLAVALYAAKAQAASAPSTYTQTTPSCSWLTCWWQKIMSFFTHLF